MLLESPVLDSVKPQGFLLIAVNGKGNDFWSVIQEDMILALHGSHASHLKHESLQNQRPLFWVISQKPTDLFGQVNQNGP